MGAAGKMRVTRKAAVGILGAGVVGTTVFTSGCQPGAMGRLAVARVAQVRPWVPVLFSYPDDYPAILLDVDRPVGGVGPRQSIVAFSAVCTHMGCTVQLNASMEIAGTSKHLLCPCHFSAFDPAALGAAIAGPATYGLPIIELEIAGDTIYATGLRQGRPIYRPGVGEQRA